MQPPRSLGKRIAVNGVARARVHTRRRTHECARKRRELLPVTPGGANTGEAWIEMRLWPITEARRTRVEAVVESGIVAVHRCTGITQSAAPARKLGGVESAVQAGRKVAVQRVRVDEGAVRAERNGAADRHPTSSTQGAAPAQKAGAESRVRAGKIDAALSIEAHAKPILNQTVSAVEANHQDAIATEAGIGPKSAMSSHVLIESVRVVVVLPPLSLEVSPRRNDSPTSNATHHMWAQTTEKLAAQILRRKGIPMLLTQPCLLWLPL